MKNPNKIIYSLAIFVFLIGCSSNSTNTQADILDVSDGVDIWNSVQYETILDLNTIMSSDSRVKTDVFMFRFKIRLENRGSKTAEGFKANLNGPLPISYIHGSVNQGNGNGRFKPNDTYEVNGYYTFESKEKMDEFIEQSLLSILDLPENRRTG